MELTWTCHICNKERPDANISVFTRDLSGEQGFPIGTVEQNVRYCNDNPSCMEKAPTFSFSKKQS